MNVTFVPILMAIIDSDKLLWIKAETTQCTWHYTVLVKMLMDHLVSQACKCGERTEHHLDMPFMTLQ